MVTARAVARLDEDELLQRLSVGLAALGARLDELSIVPAAPGGGNSGITCLARVSGGDLGEVLVVKVAPPGLAPVRNRDVLRQARLLTAVRKHSDVPVPEVVFTSEGESLAHPPAFVMRFVGGEALEPGLETDRPAPSVVRARALAAAGLLAKLHALDVGVLGLDDEPEMSLADELTKWFRAFDSVEPEYRAGHERLFPMLLASMPAGVPSAVCHGDFRLGNLLCSGDEVSAVIDWEIWSRTDPRLDLSWMLWISDPSHPSWVGPLEGMPSSAELIDHYVAGGGTRMSREELTWFRALTCYKQAATVALLGKHGRRKSDGSAPGFEALGPALVERGWRTLEGWESVA